MASILKVDEMQGVTSAGDITITGEGTATMKLQSGVAKSYCRANSSATLQNSFNIASGTDSGTGDYEFTYTNNMANNTTSGSATAVSAAANMAGFHGISATGYGIEIHNDSGSKTDSGTEHQSFGDLA